MKTYYTLFLLTLLIVNTSFAAKNIYTGYIINNDGEKIEGKIYFKGMIANEIKVKFKNTANKTKVYKAKHLQEYGFEIKKYNHTTKSYENITINYIRKQVEDAPIRFGTKNIFIQRKTKGAMNIYSQYVATDHKIGGGVEQFYYAEKGNNFVKITKSNYKSALKSLLTDFPVLQEKIGTRGYGYKHISKIAKMYNARFTQEQPLISMQD